MGFVALRTSLANTVVLVDSNRNFGQFDLLELLGFQLGVILQLASTARAIVKSKLPEAINLSFGEGRPLVSLVTWLTTLLSFCPCLLRCFLVALRWADDVRRGRLRGIGRIL